MISEREITIEPIKGNTWCIKSWVLIPFYRLDAHRCILLDTGLRRNQQLLQAVLDREGLQCVGILASHAHIDHTGNAAYLKQTVGAKLALSLGEAAVLASPLGLHTLASTMSLGQIAKDPRQAGTECVADQIIMPQDEQVDFCGVPFTIYHTPGHSVDHISVRTPDDVLYLGDALMTGKELYTAKFPYALAMEPYFQSLREIRELKASAYAVAHYGVYDTVTSHVDAALALLEQRMEDIKFLIRGDMTVGDLTARICFTYNIPSRTFERLYYFERATRSYLYYLLDRGEVEMVVQDETIRFRRLN